MGSEGDQSSVYISDGSSLRMFLAGLACRANQTLEKVLNKMVTGLEPELRMAGANRFPKRIIRGCEIRFYRARKNEYINYFFLFISTL